MRNNEKISAEQLYNGPCLSIALATPRALHMNPCEENTAWGVFGSWRVFWRAVSPELPRNNDLPVTVEFIIDITTDVDNASGSHTGQI